jgi:hypothetical protein
MIKNATRAGELNVIKLRYNLSFRPSGETVVQRS